ncbi:MAG: hypothetical protein BWK76_20315 [Desulfobulbaceae bacterium A2]|nr:MAG: hypothetical protein BWK76_20315 [Desulfobulbaceae bacterium A2]
MAYPKPHFPRILLPLVPFSLLLQTSPLLAASMSAEQWDISADKITRYENPRSVIAEGNVVLIKSKTSEKKKHRQSKAAKNWSSLLDEDDDTRTEAGAIAGTEETVTVTETLTSIKADWLVYDVDLGTAKAKGNIRIAIGPDSLNAEEGTVDLNRETGTFKNATLLNQGKDLHLEGRTIEKTGALTYHIEDGWIITCKLRDGETAPWSFAATDADITEEGYAFLKHATFRIKDMPVLYSPYMVLPAKRERQSGFLFPSFSTSTRDGFGLSLPYFINLSPSADMTIFPEYMANRGVMTGLEMRYALGLKSKGSFLGNYLQDELSDPSEVDYYRDGKYTHTNQDRYWVSGKVDHDFGNGWISRLDIDIASDRDYLTEFKSGLNGFSANNNRYLKWFGRGMQEETNDQRGNTFKLLKSWGGMSLESQLMAINDLRVDTPSPTPLWKMPSVAFRGLVPLYDRGPNLSWDTEYVDYWREEGVGAHRVDLRPKVTNKLPLGNYLQGSAAVSARETAYLIQEYGDSTWSDNTSKNRLLYDFSAEIGTTLMRDFDYSAKDVGGGSIYGLNHAVRPFVGYNFLPEKNQKDLPSFDDVDRRQEENKITYGINQFFSVLGTKPMPVRAQPLAAGNVLPAVADASTATEQEYERQVAYLRVQQGYDMRSEADWEELQPINVDLGILPFPDMNFKYKTDYDVNKSEFSLYGAEANYRNSRGDSLSLDYRFIKGYSRYHDELGTTETIAKVNSIKFRGQTRVYDAFSVMYSLERSLLDDLTVEERYGIRYQPACWAVDLVTSVKPNDETFMLIFTLANLGSPLGINLGGN